MPLQTPVLFIIFNRPDTTQRVFDQIKKVHPSKLFVSADAPRANYPGDKKLCTQARAIIEQVDWECDVKTLFHEKNLGCGLAPSTAISWFFDNVESGIVLEDDCLPSQSFFYFCQQLLERYNHDTRIMHIGGTSYQKYIKSSIKSDYYFIKIPRIWGWATWKRAWTAYDFFLRTFPTCKSQQIMKQSFAHESYQAAWQARFEKIYTQLQQKQTISAWDAQWVYAILTHHGLCITPTKNLVENIGFGENATHTTHATHFLSHKAEEIDVQNLKHPQFFTPDLHDESWAMTHIFNTIAPTGILWETKKALKKKFPFLKRGRS